MKLKTRKIKKNFFIVENTIRFYFYILIIISTILNLLEDKWTENAWTIGEWLINYQGGFVRRGLFGSIIYKLSSGLNINPILIVYFLTVLFFISFIFLLNNSRKYFSSLFLLSPMVTLAPLLGNYLVRKDISGIVAYALCTNLIVRKKNFTNFSLVNLISSMSILNHESYFFYSIPSLFLLCFFSSSNIKNSNNNFLKIYKTIIFILPSLIISGLVFYFKGNYEMAFKINESWLNLSSIIPNKQLFLTYFPSGAIGSLSWTFSKGISLSLSTIKMFDGALIWIPAMWMLTIFICAQIFIGDKNKLKGKLKLNVLLLQFTFISPLFILGWDFGRWIFLWMSSSIFLTIAFIKLKTINKNDLNNLSIINSNFFIKLFNGYELLGFKKCLYLFLGIPGCCWTIHRYLKITPIVFPFDKFLN